MDQGRDKECKGKVLVLLVYTVLSYLILDYPQKGTGW